jgi:lysophospholipase L1-like esterase
MSRDVDIMRLLYEAGFPRTILRRAAVPAAALLLLAAPSGSAAAPADAAATRSCTERKSVIVRAPPGVRRAVIIRDGERVGVVRRGKRRRVRLAAPRGATVTIRVAGRKRSGRRVVRVRRVRRCFATPRTGLIDPSNRLLRYEGRWEVDAGRATTVNSGSRIFLRFTGREVIGWFDLAGITKPPQLYAYIDGEKSERIVVERSEIELTPDGLAAGEHTLVIAVKDVDERENRWNPPFRSAVQFEGLELPDGTALRDRPPPPRDLRFTFLGDSITQGVNSLCPMTGSDCSDGTADYAWRVADAFDAQLEQVGFGGQGLIDDGSGAVPPALETIDVNFASSPAKRFDADVVVINQLTNDVIAGEQEAAIRDAYARYLRIVRERYPEAVIIALEPFGYQGAVTLYASKAIQDAVAQTGDPRVTYVSTRGWLGPADFTDGLHPSESGHQIATARLVEAIRASTGLQPASG